MKRRDLRILIMNALYQYQLLDTETDTLMENNLTYDLPKRYQRAEGAESDLMPTPAKGDFKFDSKEDIEFVVTVISNAINKEQEFEELTQSRLKDWHFHRLGYVEQAIILMALSELDLKTAPEKSIINEAVELAKIYGDEDAYKLINGLLDKIRNEQ